MNTTAFGITCYLLGDSQVHLHVHLPGAGVPASLQGDMPKAVDRQRAQAVELTNELLDALKAAQVVEDRSSVSAAQLPNSADE